MTEPDDIIQTYSHQSVICLLGKDTVAPTSYITARYCSECVETVQRESVELRKIFGSGDSPRPSYESVCSSGSEYSSPVRAEFQHFRTNIPAMPYLALR